jgi:hypothetical protein
VSFLVSLVAVLGISSSALAAPSLDVRPGTDRNVVNPDAKGVLPVALMGAADFQVEAVAVSGLALSAAGSSQSAHPKGPGHMTDLNGDGYKDLMLNFPIQGTGVKHGDTQICLAGTGFEVCDTIETVPPQNP